MREGEVGKTLNTKRIGEEELNRMENEFWRQIPFARLQMTYECLEPVKLPPYKGSALRGAFGHALKRVSCALRRQSCGECLLKHTCVYAYVFETPPPPDSEMLRLYPSVPHPFVLRPPADTKTHYDRGEILTGELILIGRAIPYLPYFVTALQLLGEQGLGHGRGKLALTEVREMNRSANAFESLYLPTSATLKSPKQSARHEMEEAIRKSDTSPANLMIQLITPLRIKFAEKFVERVEFHHLIRNLLRRLASLAYFHCETDTEGFDFRGIIREAEKIGVSERNLRWQDWERYSSRQQRQMLLGGVIGTISFASVPASFLSLLFVGEQLHVGKAASFGLGQFQINQEHGSSSSIT